METYSEPEDVHKSELATRLRSASLPAALIVIVAIKAVLSLAVKQSGPVVWYSGVSYLLILVLATSFAIYNAVTNVLNRRAFWIFLAGGYGLWVFHQWVHIYYELGLRANVPDDSMADPVLFLHLVPFMAALATFPHRDNVDRKPYWAILNSLVLLFLWGLLYLYTVLPYQSLFPNATSYALRFDILYLIENFVLVLALFVLTLRTQLPWKSIYLHFLGASALYACSSVVANYAIDSAGYVDGKLYGFGLTASVCWFAWVPMSAQRARGQETRTPQSSKRTESRASSWAMVAVVVISVPMVWELFRKEDNAGMETVRLLVAIATIVSLAVVAYIEEYLTNRELSSDITTVSDRLRAALQSGKSVGWDWDLATRQVTWFGDLQTMFGIASDYHSLSIDEFFERIHSDDRARVAAAVAQSRADRTRYAAGFRVMRFDGTVRWVTASGEFHYSSEGKPERMLGMAVDVTEHKVAEETAREHQARLTAIIDSAMDAIIAVDAQQRVSVFNAAAERMFGCQAAEALGQPLERFIPDRFRTRHREHTDAFTKDGVARRPARAGLRALRANGEEFSIEASLSRIKTEGGEFFTAIVRDVTEREQAEQLLRSSHQLNISILESLRNHMAVLDSKGVIVAATRRGAEFVATSGINSLDLYVGGDYFQICQAAAESGDHEVTAALAGVQSVYEGKRDYFELEYEHTSGMDHRSFLLSATPLKSAQGGVVIAHQDITQRKRHQQAIQELSGRLIYAQEEERSRIARELHDDINQQLAIIAIELQQLESSFPDADTEGRQKIQALWKKTHTLSADVQHLSHQLHSTKLEHLGIVVALRDLCTEFSQQHKIETDFQYRQVPARVHSEIALVLFRVAQESLHNAAKHSQAKIVRLELFGTGKNVVLRVSDDGVGFDPQEPERHTGLGMISMVERIRLVGGTLSVSSKPSLGTQIEAAIPLSHTVTLVDRVS